MSKPQKKYSHRSKPPRRTTQRRQGGMKRNRDTKDTKNVKFNPDSNTVKEYNLSQEERLEKRKKDPLMEIYPKCVMPLNLRSFPCRIGQTLFENPQEYIDFVNADRVRRSSKTPEQHYEYIEEMLKKEMEEKGIVGVSPLNRRIRG
jgi:hypothetical protein